MPQYEILVTVTIMINVVNPVVCYVKRTPLHHIRRLCRVALA